MKKIGILALIFAILFGIFTPINAEEVEVVKNGTITDFHSNIPLPTIVIDRSKLEGRIYVSNSSEIKLIQEIFPNLSDPGVIYVNENLVPGNTVTIPGGYSIIYPEAAILSDGTRGDLVIDVSDIRYGMANNSPSKQAKYFMLANWDNITCGTVDDNFKVRDYDHPDGAVITYTKSIVTVSVKKNNEKIEGKFAYGLRDLDTKNNTTGDYAPEYAEGATLLSGFNGKVYIPETNFLNINGNRFSASQPDSNTYNSGLMVLADSGFKFEWAASGYGLGTTLNDSVPFYVVENSAVNGKTMIIEGEEKVEKPVVFVREGEEVRISTMPNEGYKAKSIKSDGIEQTDFDPDFIEYNLTYSNINSNHVFFAEYEPYSYTIKYDSNGGSGTMSDSAFTYDMDKFMSKDNEFVKDHYKFIGFSLEGREGLITSPEDFKTVLVEMGDGAEITLVAQWEYEQITSFIDIETEETIIPDESGQIQPKDIDGYVYIETEADSDGNWVHKYKTVKTNYVDEDDKELLEPKPGKHDPEEITGYKHINTEDDPKGDTTHIYHKVITSWVDETGKVLHPSEDGALDPKVFPDYKLVKSEVKENGDTVHTYHHIQTSWVDEKGEKIVQSKPGEHPKETFPNYEFARTEVKTNGDVIHHYDKLVEVKFIVDGKVVKDDKIKRGADSVAPEVTPKNGYKFVGWDKEFKNIQVDTVVTAKLEPIKYPITYVLDGGKNDDSNPSSYTIEDAVTLKNPIKLGAKFLGWKEGNAIAKGSTGAKTFTAQWEIVTAPVNTGAGEKAILAAGLLIIATSLLAFTKKKK